MERWQVLSGDCLELMRGMPEASVDSIVTDPPYGLEFMGKEWDAPWKHGFSSPGYGDAERLARPSFTSSRNPICQACGKRQRTWQDGPAACACASPKWDRRQADEMRVFQAWCDGWAVEALRVAKPGAHILAFGGTRTWHRLACALEDAGWEIRDTICWMYGSGFPKSHSVHKATHDAVESRYGNLRCDCLDTGDGLAGGYGGGREDCAASRHTGGPCSVQAAALGASGASSVSGSRVDVVRELRGSDKPQAQGTAEEQKAVLFADVRGCWSEEAGHGHAAIRSGVEEHAGTDSAEGSGMPGVRSAAGRQRVACSSSETVSSGWDKQAGESGGAVRCVSSHDRSDHSVGTGLDPDRREPRRIHNDDHGGRRAAVAWVCSWCGRPDREWIDSLKPLGTALKPAFEPIILARKPLAGTVAANVERHGVGGLNIDGCRIAVDVDDDIHKKNPHTAGGFGNDSLYRDNMPDDLAPTYDPSRGRWPANVILDEAAGAALDAMTGVLKSGKLEPHHKRSDLGRGAYAAHTSHQATAVATRGDSGGASRFFYCAKSSRSERTHGGHVENKHPTVKPIALMRYLVRLVTPPGGMVLDPFCGSGTTGGAAVLEGMRFVGCEKEDASAETARQRIVLYAADAAAGRAEPKAKKVKSVSKPKPAKPEVTAPRTLMDLLGGGE